MFSRTGRFLSRSVTQFRPIQKRLLNSGKDDIPATLPSPAVVVNLPLRYCELSNEALSIMAVQGIHGAHRERLLREIMRVDEVSWLDAHKKLEEINKLNDKYTWLVTLPYKIGILSGAVFGFGSIPLIFHRDTALWFNEHFVHEDLPDGGAEALDTAFKVGAWSWGFMEPVLGTASFVLLCMQLMRSQMLNMSLQPYSGLVLNWRARRLCRLFPKYHKSIISDFAQSDPWDK